MGSGICIIKVVKLQRKFFMMSINRFSILAPRTFCLSSLAVFFDFNIIFSLEVSVWYQWRSSTRRNSLIFFCTKNFDFSCQEHFLKFDTVDVNFCGICFLANRHGLSSSSLLTHLLTTRSTYPQIVPFSVSFPNR